MTKLAYEKWSPGPDARAMVAEANAICADYQRQGYDLTLRQLYYQFVSRALIPNNQRSYDQLGAVVNRARMAGLMDWNYIVDRTRNLQSLSHWTTPGGVIRSAAQSYANNLWADQDEVVEVWVEKEALAGIVDRAASAWDCSWFSCRGYVSQSEMWAAGRRILDYIEAGKRVTILHLGDHDPSGIDMTRDIRDRLTTFWSIDYFRKYRAELEAGDITTVAQVVEHVGEGLVGDPLTVNRIALNREQVDLYQPPPNPAKMSDSRATGYVDEHGYQSWELDALDPATLDALIQDHIAEIVDDERFFAARDRQERGRRQLLDVSGRFDAIVTEWVDDE
jgi:hypothetical protein